MAPAKAVDRLFSFSFSVETELVRGIVQGYDVFWWDTGLDIVDVVEHVAAAWLPDFKIVSNVFPNLGR